MQTVVDYFQQVLGVREILWNYQPTVAEQLAKVRVAFIAEPSTLQNSSESELLDKMLAAMKLGPEEVLVKALSLAEVAEQVPWLETLPAVMVFSDSLHHFLSTNFPNMHIYQGPSPVNMLKNAALKRDAWETLKLVLKNIE